MKELIEKGKLAKEASYRLASLSSGDKNNALSAIARALRENTYSPKTKQILTTA